jgi:hypothetical protein
MNPDAREIVDAPKGVHKKRLNVYRRIEYLRLRGYLFFVGR